MKEFMKKPVFSSGNANWLSELRSVEKQYNNTNHSSIKMTPFPIFKKSNEKEVYSNLQDKSELQRSNMKRGKLVRTADIRRVFNEEDSANWSYKLYTLTQRIHESFPNYRNNYLPER